MDEKEIEKRFYALGAKIAAHDDVALEVKKIIESLVEINLKGDVFEKFQTNVQKIVEQLRMKTDLDSKRIEDHIASSTSELKLLKEKHASLYDIYADIYPKLDENQQLFLKEIEAFKVHFLDILNGLLVKQEGLSQSLSSFSQKMTEGLSNCEKRHIALTCKVDLQESSLHQKIADEKQDVNKILDFKHDLFLKALQLLKSEFYDALQKHGKQVSSDLENVKNGFPVYPEKSFDEKTLEKIEMVALDASNAYLKANNLESQIKFLDKKLENLQLLLKQHELAK